MTYNAGERKDVRKAEKSADIAEAQRAAFIRQMMNEVNGRAYAYHNLARCHVFTTSFNTNALAMAFAEGERNSGLQLLNDILTYCPDQYVNMMREARQNDGHNGNDRSPSNNNATNDDYSSGSEHTGVEDARRDDQGPNPITVIGQDYNPFDAAR